MGWFAVKHGSTWTAHVVLASLPAQSTKISLLLNEASTAFDTCSWCLPAWGGSLGAFTKLISGGNWNVLCMDSKHAVYKARISSALCRPLFKHATPHTRWRLWGSVNSLEFKTFQTSINGAFYVQFRTQQKQDVMQQYQWRFQVQWLHPFLVSSKDVAEILHVLFDNLQHKWNLSMLDHHVCMYE